MRINFHMDRIGVDPLKGCAQGGGRHEAYTARILPDSNRLESPPGRLLVLRSGHGFVTE